MSVTAVFNAREHYLGVFREQSAQLADLKAGFQGSELRAVDCPPP